MYFVTVDTIDDEISTLENKIVNSDDPVDHLKEIYQMKNKVQVIFQDAKAMREVIDALIDDYDMIISSESVSYLKDLQDHLMQVTDDLDGFRSTLSSIIDLSSAVAGNKLNEIMKFLTVLSTFFLPLTLICAWWGVNIKQPELEWRFMYPTMIFLSILSVIMCFVYFKKKKWL
jgi:magnesium transporter